jgi:hypothetical protein
LDLGPAAWQAYHAAQPGGALNLKYVIDRRVLTHDQTERMNCMTFLQTMLTPINQRHRIFWAEQHQVTDSLL